MTVETTTGMAQRVDDADVMHLLKVLLKASGKNGTRWEYMTHVFGGTILSPDPAKALNKLGLEGWELVAVAGGMGSVTKEAFLKRPLPQ